MKHRFRQDGLNVEVIHGDALIAAIGDERGSCRRQQVLEWVATGASPDAQAGSPQRCKAAPPRSIRSALRPGGRIRNRDRKSTSLRYFGARFRTMRCRPWRSCHAGWPDAVTRWRRGKPYRTWIYSAPRHKRHALQEAGFHRDRVLCRAADLSPPGSGGPLRSRRRDPPLREPGLACEAARVAIYCSRGAPGPDRPFISHRCEQQRNGLLRGLRRRLLDDPRSRISRPECGKLVVACARVGRSRALVIGDPRRSAGAACRRISSKSRTFRLRRSTTPPGLEGQPQRESVVCEDASVDCVVSTDLVNAWSTSSLIFPDPRLVAALTTKLPVAYLAECCS